MASCASHGTMTIRDLRRGHGSAANHTFPHSPNPIDEVPTLWTCSPWTRAGKAQPNTKLMELVYDELRALATCATGHSYTRSPPAERRVTS